MKSAPNRRAGDERIVEVPYVVASKTACEEPSPCRQRGQQGRPLSVGAAAGSVAVSAQTADGAWLIALDGEHDLLELRDQDRVTGVRAVDPVPARLPARLPLDAP